MRYVIHEAKQNRHHIKQATLEATLRCYKPGNGHSKGYPMVFLCSWKDLDDPRRNAARVLRTYYKTEYPEVQEVGKNAYAAAKDLLTREKKWNKIRGRLNWSKFVRSLIFPSLLIATFLRDLISLPIQLQCEKLSHNALSSCQSDSWCDSPHFLGTSLFFKKVA